MKTPENLLYTKEHEWVLIEGDTATVGITEYAQQELGDIVYVELPGKGDQIEQMQACGSIEAVKAVSDLFAPVSGEVIEVNEALDSNPQLVNQDAFGDGWMFKVRLTDPDEAKKLLNAGQYQELVGS